MRRRCPKARKVGVAELRGWRLDFTGYSRSRGWTGTATITPHSGGVVAGVIYMLTTHDVSRLDGFEGCPTVYCRRELTVFDEAGRRYNVQVYRKVDRSFSSPSDRYLEIIYTGLLANNQCTDGLMDAYERAINGEGGAERHRVFVYGSLLKGLGNHIVLCRKGSAFDGVTETVEDSFEMVSMGAFPAVFRLPSEHAGVRVRGEVYEVTDAGLRALDRLEGHPRFYKREKIALKDGSKAWAYMMTGLPEEQGLDEIVELHKGAADWREYGHRQKEFRFDHR